MNRPTPTKMPQAPKPAPHRTVVNEPTNQDLELQLGVALTKIHRLEQQVEQLQDNATGLPNLYRDGDKYYIRVNVSGPEDKDLVTIYANDKPYQVNRSTGHNIGVGKTESFQSNLL